MNKKFEKILSLPKSLYVSIKLCGFNKGIKLPVLVRYNTVLRDLSGQVEAPSGGVRIGFDSGEGTADYRFIRSVLEISGTIKVKKSLQLGIGTRLCVSGCLNVVSAFNTSRLHLVCMKSIKMGQNVLIAWDACIMDSDMHTIKDLNNNLILPKDDEVTIGDNVWIGTRSLILKGTHIPNGCIIGARSVVTKKYIQENAVIAGNPAKIIKTGYTRFE